jgi:hypothetical protein
LRPLPPPLPLPRPLRVVLPPQKVRLLLLLQVPRLRPAAHLPPVLRLRRALRPRPIRSKVRNRRRFPAAVAPGFCCSS